MSEQSPARKILVTVDGSVYSNNAINYLIDLYADTKNISFHLFSVFSPGPLPPAGQEWMDELSLMNALSKEARNRYSRTRRFLNTATEHMVRGGFDPAQISTEVQWLKMGIAADVLQKATNGLYDALIIGRRGIGKIEELFMGSVSASILGKNHEVPIWIVDKQVKSDRFLVPVDGSLHSLKAVDHLGYMLADHPRAEITLFHSSALLAARPSTEPVDFHAQWGKEWCEEYLEGPDGLHLAPRQLLIEGGVDPARIYWQHAAKGIEPARQIIRQALIDDFGTIVMGRRSDAGARGLLKSVSDRVVFMADKVAIWIVG